ncbi:MAG: hypothetical protein ABW194_02340 [Novosphingobium sp.]
MRWTIVAGLVLAAAPLHAQPGGAERLTAPPLPGFVEGFAATNTERSIREEVPTGETVEAWRRMVTTQRFTGLAARGSPLVYAGNILSHVPKSCPGARTSKPVRLTVSGRPGVQFEVDCPGSARAQRERFVMLAIAGQSDMHVKQVAWRGTVTAKDLEWGHDFLAKVALCGPGATCRR